MLVKQPFEQATKHKAKKFKAKPLAEFLSNDAEKKDDTNQSRFEALAEQEKKNKDQ